MNQINIDTMSVVELKAIAFDTLVNIEQQQNNLKVINQKIVEKSKEVPVTPEEVTPEVLPETPASE